MRTAEDAAWQDADDPDWIAAEKSAAEAEKWWGQIKDAAGIWDRAAKNLARIGAEWCADANGKPTHLDDLTVEEAHAINMARTFTTNAEALYQRTKEEKG